MEKIQESHTINKGEKKLDHRLKKRKEKKTGKNQGNCNRIIQTNEKKTKAKENRYSSYLLANKTLPFLFASHANIRHFLDCHR